MLVIVENNGYNIQYITKITKEDNSMNKKKGCFIAFLMGFGVFVVVILISVQLIINYGKESTSEQVTNKEITIEIEPTEKPVVTNYIIEDISKGKYYVFDNEYEKLYEKACNAAIAWVDLYEEYKPIEDSKLTIYDDGSIAMQIYSIDDKGVTVTYTTKDKNGDRERIAIMYDTENGIETITEK